MNRTAPAGLLLASIVTVLGCGGPESATTRRDAAVTQADGGSGDGARPDVPDEAPPALLTLGGACTADAACESGHCVDGVCCQSTCEGKCQSCAVPGSAGTCKPAGAGTDPRNDCNDEGVASCGADGLCDGAGACRKYPTGTICTPTSCTGSVLTAAARCDATSACVPGTPQPCDPFVCGAGDCLNTCTKDADCVAPSSCNAGSCGKRPVGKTCAADAECNSGHCAQGVCCGTTCTGTCRSCGVAGSAGTCIPVPADADPLDQCTAAAATTCGLDGACDGAGACRLYKATTVCVPAVCKSGAGTPSASCDGKGVCAMVGPAKSCGNFGCSAQATCLTTCTTNAECLPPSVCGGGSCGGLQGQYFDNIDFTMLLVTRTDATLNVNWNTGVPDPKFTDPDTFSVRWTGKVTPRFSETYTFYVGSNDGNRLWIDGKLLIDDFTDHLSSAEDMGTIALTAGQSYSVRLDYYDNTGSAAIHFSWSSPSEPKAIVPTSHLSPQ